MASLPHPHSHEPKPLFLIQPRLNAADYRDKLIGSVVRYPDLPTEAHIPYDTKKLPREMVTDLDPRPVQVHNVKFWTRRIKDAKVSAALNDIVEFFAERAREDRSERTATVARMWHMDAPGQKFKELLKNRQYYEELVGLLRERNEGYFVTDVVTLVNLQMKDSTSRTIAGGAGAQVPLDAAAGLVSAGARGRVRVTREQGASVAYDEESIVFLGYRRVRLEKVHGARAKLGRVFLGRTHGFAIRDGMDFWPEMTERPAEGNVPGFMGAPTTPGVDDYDDDDNILGERGEGDGGDDDDGEIPMRESQREREEEEEEFDGIVSELGFDVRIVG